MFIVNNNSSIQDYVHPDDRTQRTYEITSGFKPFIVLSRTTKNKQVGTNSRCTLLGSSLVHVTVASPSIESLFTQFQQGHARKLPLTIQGNLAKTIPVKPLFSIETAIPETLTNFFERL